MIARLMRRCSWTNNPPDGCPARTEWSQLPLYTTPVAGHATVATHCECPVSAARASSSSGAAGTATALSALPSADAAALRFFALRDSGGASAAAAAASLAASSSSVPARPGKH